LVQITKHQASVKWPCISRASKYDGGWRSWSYPGGRSKIEIKY